MDKISAVISDDTCSSCITCQIPGDFMFSHASSILVIKFIKFLDAVKTFFFSTFSVYYVSSLSSTST